MSNNLEIPTSGWFYRSPSSFSEVIGTLVPVFVGFIILYDAAEFWFFNTQVGNVGLAVSGVLSIAFTSLYFFLRPPRRYVGPLDHDFRLPGQ
jgi:hypothetical protein